MQVAARVEHGDAVQIEPEEALQKDAPDICLLSHTGPQREVAQTTECKTK